MVSFFGFMASLLGELAALAVSSSRTQEAAAHYTGVAL
ncbi:Hypothetical protein A7982_04048 [Minicystis rosea]|nr:Hypothetical protein A7982_04048 [Minicystis rosea]